MSRKAKTGYAIARDHTTAALKALVGADGRAEYHLHCQIVELLTLNRLPGVIYFHCPNGAKRSHGEAVALKAMGMTPGVADLCISIPGGRFAFMEIKTKAGTLSDVQETFLAAMDRNGHPTAVVRSFEEAADILASWGAIRGVNAEIGRRAELNLWNGAAA